MLPDTLMTLETSCARGISHVGSLMLTCHLKKGAEPVCVTLWFQQTGTIAVCKILVRKSVTCRRLKGLMEVNDGYCHL